MFMRRLALATALTVTGLSAHAQEGTAVENGQRFGEWTVNCQATGPGRTRCVLVQQVLRSADRELVAQIIAFQSPDQSQTFISARVPVGVYFPSGFAIRADNSEDVSRFVWQTCGRDLCEAVLATSPEQLAELSAEGRNVIAGYQPGIQAEQVVFQMSFAGVVEGLEALSTGNE